MSTPDARRNDKRQAAKSGKLSRHRYEFLKRKKRQPFQPDFHGLERRLMPSTFTVADTSDADAGSLRQAILDSNAAPGSNTIDFDIGSGPQTISLLSALPAITVTVDIDGTTQPGYQGSPMIQLDGTGAGAADGLDIEANNCTIKGLSITGFSAPGFSGFGILLSGASFTEIQRNYIGVDLSGAAARGIISASVLSPTPISTWSAQTGTV